MLELNLNRMGNNDCLQFCFLFILRYIEIIPEYMRSTLEFLFYFVFFYPPFFFIFLFFFVISKDFLK